ncbi:MAG: S-layer homology domain-containing protein [Anaerovoracaceae bacterium]|jgi:hypothetical protein
MKKNRVKGILSIILAVVLVLGLMPIEGQLHVHAGYEDGQDCVYCGEYRYDDWLCDGCGGCSENAGGGDCYADHHCPECGDCESSGLDHCGNCMRCEECIDICSNCELCIDCGAYGIEYLCGSCGQCPNCVSGSMCFECGYCESCHGGDQCSSDACRKCANCYEARCPECERCNDCNGDLYCPDCWLCAFCAGGDICLDCYRDRNCTTLCSACGDYCIECADGFCDECELCSECTEFLDCCGGCLKCAEAAGLQFCVDCGRCEDCSEGFCGGCGLCSECAFICTGCGEYCSECADAFCNDCDQCAECVTICLDCESVCAECAASFCETCQKCDGCVDVCPECGEYCNECAEVCGNCGYCENCAEICVSCGYFCSECNIICPECGLCAEDCTSICLGCFDTCIDCADAFCENCQLCDACTEICLECGEACSECTAFCAGCGVCGNCETVCESCSAYCSGCALVCPIHGECENCIDICVTCETYCEYDALICFACGECEVCTDLYSTYHYDKHDHWFICTCGQIHGQESHSWGSWTIHEPATATQNGVKSRTCRECAYTAHEIIPASHEHIPSEWIPDTPATETADGTKYKMCMICNEVLETGIIPALDPGHTHAWGSIWEYDNTSHWLACTCGKKGYVSYHDAGDWIIDVEPTETTEGSRHRACNRCGYITVVETIPAIGSIHTHDWIDAWFRDEASHWHACACGAEKDMAAHIAGDWIADIAATETTEGSRHKECLVCGHIMDTATIPATGTNHTHEWANTWSYNKINHWYECPCGEKKDIAAHIPGGWIIDTPATATKKGSKHKECTVCGYVIEVESIPARGGSSGGGSQNKDENESPSGNNVPAIEYTTTNNTAVVDLPESKVQEIINNTQDGKAVIDLSGAISTTQAILPKTALEGIGKAGLEISIQLVEGSLSMDLQALASIVNQTNGETITMGIENKGKLNLNELQSNAIQAGDNVYDISISSGNRNITNFEGKLNMTLPYDGPQPVAIWYLNDIGEREKIESTYKDGFVYFTLSHLSLYIVGKDNRDMSFKDVKEENWFYESVKYVYENDLMNGTGDNRFSPDGVATRGMIVTILHRLEGLPLGKENKFTDVEEGKYYVDSVVWASENGIVSGYGNNKFGPEDPITREQLAGILLNYTKYKGNNVSLKADLERFEDSKEISDWAMDAMSWANAEELIQGDGKNLTPRGNATRAQVAAILYRFVKK